MNYRVSIGIVMSLIVLGALFVVPVVAQGPEMVRVVVHIDKGQFKPNGVLGIGGHVV